MAGPDTSTPVEERTLEDLLRTALPPTTVVLHNDDVNSMGHVIISLLESVPELEPDRAVEVMLTAHERGQADVITCPLERAELYRDRLVQHNLIATIRR